MQIQIQLDIEWVNILINKTFQILGTSQKNTLAIYDTE
jgi:hypothetical protein